MDWSSIISSGIGATASHISDAVNFFSNRNANASNRAIADNTNVASAMIANANNVFQAQMNEANNQFSHDEAELAFQRQLQLMAQQAEYNSPLWLMEQAAKAGLNPSVFLSKSYGNASSAQSAPQAQPHGSGVSPNMPNLVMSQMAPFRMESQGLTSNVYNMAAALAQVAQAKKQGAETKEIETLLDGLALGQDLDNKLKDTQIRIAQTFGMREASVKIMETYAHACAMIKEGDLIAANAAKSRAEEQMYQALTKLHGKQYDRAKFEFEHIQEEWDAKLDNLRSQSVKNRAEASEANANAQTINELRDSLVKIKFEELKSSQYARRSAALEMLSSYEDYQNKHLTPEQRKLFVDKVTETLKNELTEEEWKRIVSSNPSVGILGGFLNSVGSAVIGSSVKLLKP